MKLDFRPPMKLSASSFAALAKVGSVAAMVFEIKPAKSQSGWLSALQLAEKCHTPAVGGPLAGKCHGPAASGFVLWPRSCSSGSAPRSSSLSVWPPCVRSTAAAAALRPRTGHSSIRSQHQRPRRDPLLRQHPRQHQRPPHPQRPRRHQRRRPLPLQHLPRLQLRSPSRPLPWSCLSCLQRSWPEQEARPSALAEPTLPQPRL